MRVSGAAAAVGTAPSRVCWVWVSGCGPTPVAASAARPGRYSLVGGHLAGPPTKGPARAQDTLSAVSSTTNEVCNELSSAPMNLTVIVWPAKLARLKDFCVYPVPLLRLE